MDTSFILPTAWLLLKPLLEKASEKAAETIGEKLGEKTVEKSFWQKVKGLFIIEEEKQFIESLEKKSIASSSEIIRIEQKVQNELTINPQFVKEVKDSLNINIKNEEIILDKLESIKRLQKQIKSLESEMEDAGIGTVGDYKNRIKLQTSKLFSQVDEISKILNSK